MSGHNKVKEEWEDQGYTLIYTDGSRINNNTGWGLHWNNTSTSGYLGLRATVNDAEMYAIKQAEQIVDRELVIVCSDK